MVKKSGKELRGGWGWPQPALIEVLVDVYGIGELHRLLPLIRSLVASSESSLIVWLNPPHTPNAVGLAQCDLRAVHWLANDLSELDGSERQ